MDTPSSSSTAPLTENKSIFDEFSQSEELKKEVQKAQEDEGKDIYYYLSYINILLGWCNVIIFFLLVLAFIYVYINKDTSGRDYAILRPICRFINGDTQNTTGLCQSVNYTLTQYQNTNNEMKMAQGKEIEEIIDDLYAFENFESSQKVKFILDESKNRLRPLKILSDFDAIKSKFSPIDASEVSCNEIIILKDSINMACDVYSSDWDSTIPELKDGAIKNIAVWGTSISKAMSFMDFLENYPDSPFRIIEKQGKLNSDSIDIPPYTQKTNLQLKLQYVDISPLAF